MKTLNFLNRAQLFALAGLLFVGTSCENEKGSDNSVGTSTVKMHLTDAPAVYDAVNIDVEEVRIHVSLDGDTTGADSTSSGWHTLTNFNPGIYNLLDFQNGLDTLLGEAIVPAGKVSQIRLILGSDNSVVVDGVSHNLKTPSGQQSGLKLNVHYDLEPNLVYEFYIDFDASKSVVEKGNGTYSLKPVIKVYTKNTTGSIEGYIDPANASTSILAYSGADSANTLSDTTSGYFLLGGLNAGSYTVEFDADSTFTDTTLTGVMVNVGQVTSLDTVSVQ